MLLSWVGYQWLTWPDVEALIDRNPPTTAFIEDFRRSGREQVPEQQWVAYDRISDNLKHAVLVSEDIDFHGHHGFAVGEIRIALVEAVKEGRSLRGASTISQQLAKNLWLSPSRNPWRKVKEALLTHQLERALTKRRILEIYLNVAQFGPHVFGAEAASMHFFSAPSARLTRRQAALLATSLPQPDNWYPGCASERYERRAELVLARMGKSQWLRDQLSPPNKPLTGARD